MDNKPNESTAYDSERAMQKACTAGDLLTLQDLLRDNHQQNPNIHGLLTTAITSQNTAIVAYLLSTYPNISLSQHIDIVQYVLSSSDISILQILLAHDPNFASISLDYGMRCFLTEACFCPPARIEPLIHVLLDTGADVNDGLGPGGGALLASLEGGQSKDIVLKIVKKGGEVSNRVIYAAAKKSRVDVLPLLLRVGGGRIKREELERWAKESENEGVKTLVEEYIGSVIKGITEYEKENEAEVKEGRGWWQILGKSRK